MYMYHLSQLYKHISIYTTLRHIPLLMKQKMLHTKAETTCIMPLVAPEVLNNVRNTLATPVMSRSKSLDQT